MEAPEPLMAPEGRTAEQRPHGITRWWIPALIVAFALTFLGGAFGAAFLSSNEKSSNAENIAKQIEAARLSSRSETCTAFDHLYQRERARLIDGERQLLSGKWKHLLNLRKSDYPVLHKENRKRYYQSGNETLPSYCIQSGIPTKHYPSLEELRKPPKPERKASGNPPAYRNIESFIKRHRP